MRRLFFGFLFIVGLSFVSEAFAAEQLVIADFNKGKLTSTLGHSVEVWLKGQGADETQITKMSIVDEDALGAEGGKAVRLDYDVDSPNPAYNGIRTDLGSFDASKFTHLNFYVKGDASAGYSTKFKIELIGSNKRPSPYIFSGVTEDWQKVSIPFSEFWVVNDWSALSQFVVVFADIVNKPKQGTLYFDQLYFSAE